MEYLEAVLKDEILPKYQAVADQPESTFHGAITSAAIANFHNTSFTAVTPFL